MIEIILDASQLEVFEPCPYKWYLDHILNLTTIHPNPNLSTGSFFHECLKYYYSKGLNGGVLGHHLKESIIWAKDLAYSYEAKRKYPAVYKEPKFHLERLRDYMFKYIDIDESATLIAVEKGFSWLLYEDAERRYILEGMIDIVWNRPKMGLTVMDHKTQSRMYDKYEYNHQIMNYLSFTGANYFEYNFIGLQQAIGENTFRRPIYKFAPYVLEQWKRDVKRTFDEMYERRLKMDLEVFNGYLPEDVYNKRRSACTTQFGVCQFYERCQVPDNSKWVPIVLSHYREKDERWRAWT